jgi:hypothetical protein
MVLYLCVLIVFSLRRESLNMILIDESLPEVVLSHTRFLEKLWQKLYRKQYLSRTKMAMPPRNHTSMQIYWQLHQEIIHKLQPILVGLGLSDS